MLIQTKFGLWLLFSNTIDLAPIEIPIGAKSIGKWQLQSKFGSDQQDSEKISLWEVSKLSSEMIGE